LREANAKSKADFPLPMTADRAAGFTANGVRCGAGVHMVAKTDPRFNRAFSFFINVPETYRT
jgi:hypothetical protein